MVGSKCNLKTHVRNLGYPFPLQIGAQNQRFGPTSQLNGNFNGLYLVSIVAHRHIFGGAHPRGYDRQTQTRPRFFTKYSQVSSSYVYSFGSYRVDKQTEVAENMKRSSLRYDVG